MRTVTIVSMDHAGTVTTDTGTTHDIRTVMTIITQGTAAAIVHGGKKTGATESPDSTPIMGFVPLNLSDTRIMLG